MPSNTALAMLKQPPKLVSITSCHFSWSIRFMVESRVMPALLTSTSTGPSRLRPADALLARVEVGDVPFVGRDAGALGECARALVVAGIVRGDLHAHVLERDADRLANARVPPVTIATRAMTLSLCCKPTRLCRWPPAFKFAADQRSSIAIPSGDR